MHVTSLYPGRDAVIVTVTPLGTPAPLIRGVASLVTSSVDEAPRSDVVARSGNSGAVGATVSIVTFVDDTVEVTALCVCVLVTVQTPSLISPKSHPSGLVVATNVQVRVVEPLTAVIVTVAPTIRLVATMAGVLSEVMLSVDEVPRSDDATRSGVEVGSATGLVLVALIDV